VQPAEQGNPGETAQPETTGQPGHAGGPGGAAQATGPGSADRESGALPGLPRLFFADEPDQLQQRQGFTDRPYGQPVSPLQRAGSGSPASPGQPGGPGNPERPGQARALARSAQRPTRPRPTRPRPTRPPDRELRQRAIASLVLGALSLVALFGLRGDHRRFVYLLIFSAVIGAAAAAIGISAVLKARRTSSYRPRGAVGGIVLGALAAVLSIPILALYLAFSHQVDNYLTCINQAQSSGSQRSCMDRFYRSIHMGSPGQGTGAAARPERASARSTDSPGSRQR
jgi:hypothetical protein